MSDRGGGHWDPASIGAFVGAAAAAILGAIVKLRSVFAKRHEAPPERPQAQPGGHVDTDSLLDVISRLGEALRERDRKIDSLDLQVRQLVARVQELEAEQAQWRRQHGSGDHRPV